MGCLACGQDLHDECDSQPCCCNEQPESTEKSKYLKSDDEIGVSAGRKRAAVEYKIYSEKPCEWRWKSNCGGGKHPIIGCLNGIQEARHHGPVKNTSRNEPSNVHLICHQCHNRWHSKNDDIYSEEEFEKLPHEPRMMTPDQILEAG